MHFEEFIEAGGEIGQPLIESPLLLAEAAGGKMNDPSVIAEGHDLRIVGIVGPREDVDADTTPTELPGRLAKKHVHAAGVPLAEASKRASVDADERDPQMGLLGRQQASSSVFDVVNGGKVS